MKKYIGVKLIEAEPEEKSVAPDMIGAGSISGYKVVYPDGYVSWSPKDVFEEAYRETDGLTFGLALEALKKGFAICRPGWNGKGMHVTKSKLYTPENIQVNNDCLLLFNVDGHYNTWVPSITDIMAEDWQIVE